MFRCIGFRELNTHGYWLRRSSIQIKPLRGISKIHIKQRSQLPGKTGLQITEICQPLVSLHPKYSSSVLKMVHMPHLAYLYRMK